MYQHIVTDQHIVVYQHIVIDNHFVVYQHIAIDFQYTSKKLELAILWNISTGQVTESKSEINLTWRLIAPYYIVSVVPLSTETY